MELYLVYTRWTLINGDHKELIQVQRAAMSQHLISTASQNIATQNVCS